jgi:iron(III) transport system ATP-binding protein
MTKMADPAPAPTAALSVEKLSRRYGSTLAVNQVSLTAQRGEIVCLLGQSGCGKTTLLRLIAGIEQPDSGIVRFGPRTVSGPDLCVPPEHRAVGLVFQDYALFPHLTILENAMFGLAKLAATERRERARSALARASLAEHADSYPHMLSGGEQQRAALARALAPQPELMLMDEPFSNLDRRLRDSVRDQTLDILRASGITTIIVTHDPEEALRIADRIVLMRKGTVVQTGTPQEMYRSPATLFAARFFSELSAVSATCLNGRADTPFGSFAALGIADGAPVTVGVRPHSLSLDENGIPARVIGHQFLGDSTEMTLVIDGVPEPVMARLPQTSARAGDTVRLKVLPETVVVLPAED